MLKTINPLILTILFTESNNEKAAKPQYLLRIFKRINNKKNIKTKIINNPKKALNYAKEVADKQDLIVVAGSIYLAGEILRGLNI